MVGDWDGGFGGLGWEVGAVGVRVWMLCRVWFGGMGRTGL